MPGQVQTISIDRHEAIRINDKAVTAADLAARLAELKRESRCRDCPSAGPRLPVQKLVALMDALQRAQISKVGIATKAGTN